MKGTLLKDFGGRDRHLRYDANAWAELGDRLGLTLRLGSFQKDLLEKPLPLSALRTFVWAGLLHDDPALDEKTVGSWIDEDRLPEVLSAFFSRFGGMSPEAESPVPTPEAGAPTAAAETTADVQVS